MKLNAKELRDLEEKRVTGKLAAVKRNPIYFILENIYDTYNVGGLFRLADAIAAEKIYLCGTTEIPPNSRIKKASIGTYKIVPWEYHKSAKEAIKELRTNVILSTFGKLFRVNLCQSELSVNSARNQANRKKYGLQPRSFVADAPQDDMIPSIKIIAVEQHQNAIDYPKADYQLPLALVFGNETYGVLPQTLELVDQIVEIPMWGINKSLNVIVSAAIVSYWVINKDMTNFK